VSPPLRIENAAWLALVSRAGGVTALAAELGTTRSTLHRWIAGEVEPAPIVRAAVAAWAKRRGLETPFAVPQRQRRRAS
jgi:hypothetical protein